ncbi:MAG: ATP synthase subunit C [Pseudomonadota bacterium]
MTQTHRRGIGLVVMTLLVGAGGLALALMGTEVLAAATEGREVAPEVKQWGYIAAALATGLSALAGGYAVASVGSAAVGAAAENPDLFGRLLIFVGLAEGIAIYGLIISILILNQLG